MGEVRKIEIDQQVIFEIDYSDCNTEQMISLLSKLQELVLAEKNPCLILGCFAQRNFLTPTFVRYAEKVTKETLHRIKKMAITGTTTPQKFIIKGYNILFQRNFKLFDTREEAIRYLLDPTTFDDDLPEYFKTNPTP